MRTSSSPPGPAERHGLSLAGSREVMGVPASGRARAAGLTNWQLAAGRLYALQQAKRLFAIDAETGQFVWCRWAPGARGRLSENGGQFHPFYHAGNTWVAAQTAGGHCLVIDSQSGRILHEVATASTPWPWPPLAPDDQHLCLIPDSQHVTLLEPATGKVCWSCETPKPSITGAVPVVAWNDSTLLVWCDGWQLQRLDPRHWHGPLDDGESVLAWTEVVRDRAVGQ